MSEEEFAEMKDSGTLQMGADGRSHVTLRGADQSGGTGPVRADFNVPTDSLQRAAKDEWRQIFETHRTPVTGLRRGN